jgi:hypothetical protein
VGAKNEKEYLCAESSFQLRRQICYGGLFLPLGANRMKGHHQMLAIASVVLALPLLAYSQSATSQGSQGTQNAQAPIRGHHEATLMKPARAVLLRSLDSVKDQNGSSIQAKLTQTVTLSNGTKLPKNSVLLGQVTQDDMHRQGMSKLALRFNEARLKDGTTVPVRATIVGYFSPNTINTELGGEEITGQVPNSWTAKTLQVDQENVTKGVDLHSTIASKNSGVFVSTKKDDVKLRAGSELQFALGPGTAAMSNVGSSSSTSGGQS